MDDNKPSITTATSNGVADHPEKVPSPMEGDASPAKSPVDQDAIVTDEPTPLSRPLYVASDILQPEPPPNLDASSPPMSRFRLVPVTDGNESSAASSPSMTSHYPSPEPLPETDGLSTGSLAAHHQSLLIGPTPMNSEIPGETPIPPPPDTPLNQVPEMETHRQYAAFTRSSMPPDFTPRGQLNEHREVKSESPGLDALRLPPESSPNAIRHQSNPPPSLASTSSSHSRNLSAPGPLTAASTRRTTRGSLAAAAEAAKQPRFNIIAPGPGGGFQVSHNTYLVTQKKDWMLPEAQFGVSLAQIIPVDCQAKPWMRLTRHPIIWDGRTDAGGKTGKKLMVAPTAPATDPALQEEGGRLDGLHMLMDYRENERPIYSYALMTRFAILGSPSKCLSLAEIYVMLEAKFPYFEHDQSKWRDSIRYNLSSNRWFVKTKRLLHQPGVGSLWKVDETSSGGPKRPRNRQRNGTAFADADDDEDDDFDEEFDLPPKESTTRNGTLMLTFDSKQPVPLDKRQAERAVSGHAQHHQISRIPSHSDEPPTTSSWSAHHPSEEAGAGSYTPMHPVSGPGSSSTSATMDHTQPNGRASSSDRLNQQRDDVRMDDSEQSGDDISSYTDDADAGVMDADVEMAEERKADNARTPKNPAPSEPVTSTSVAAANPANSTSMPYHPSLARSEQPPLPSRASIDPRNDDHLTGSSTDGISSSRHLLATASLPNSSALFSRSSASKPLAPAPTAPTIFSKPPITSTGAQTTTFTSLRPGAAPTAPPSNGSPTLPSQTPRPLAPASHTQLRAFAQLPSRDATRTPPRSTTPSRAGSNTPPRPDYHSLPSPYTTPALPFESRKRKLLMSSPATSRTSLDTRSQKVRKLEEDRQRRSDRPERRVNPAFGGAAIHVSGTRMFGGPRSSVDPAMPPPPLPGSTRLPGSSRARDMIGFATDTTSRSFTTPTSGSRFSARSSANPASSSAPLFGQSGMVMTRPSSTVSIAGNGAVSSTSSTGQGFGAFSRSQHGSFFPTFNSQQNGEGMDIDTDEDEPPRSRTRTTSVNSRMEMDRSDEEDEGDARGQSMRHQPVTIPGDPNVPRREPRFFAQFAARGLGSSLSVSVPVSSSRMERGPPTPQDSTMQSPTTSQSHEASSRLGQPSQSSSRLPPINSLPHQSSPPNYSSSLPPIRDLIRPTTSSQPSAADVVSPTQPLPPQTTAIPQPILPTPPRTASPSLPRAVSPTPAPRPPAPAGDGETAPRRPVYFGFLMMNGAVTSRLTRPLHKPYNGGDDNDNPPPLPYHNPWGFRD